jgi:hypothetical protein
MSISADGSRVAATMYRLGICVWDLAVSDVPDIVIAHPETLNVGTPVPNPAAETVLIPVASQESRVVSISIVNMQGVDLMSVSQRLSAGNLGFYFDISDLPSGSYRVVARSDETIRTQPLTIVR